MAGRTVGESLVVELPLLPVRRALVAVAALARVMVKRCILGVAGRAVGEPFVVKLDLDPLICAQVATAAIARIVVERGILGVTLLAIAIVRVVKPDICPCVRTEVAVAALALLSRLSACCGALPQNRQRSHHRASIRGPHSGVAGRQAAVDSAIH